MVYSKTLGRRSGHGLMDQIASRVVSGYTLCSVGRGDCTQFLIDANVQSNTVKGVQVAMATTIARNLRSDRS